MFDGVYWLILLGPGLLTGLSFSTSGYWFLFLSPCLKRCRLLSDFLSILFPSVLLLSVPGSFPLGVVEFKLKSIGSILVSFWGWLVFLLLNFLPIPLCWLLVSLFFGVFISSYIFLGVIKFVFIVILLYFVVAPMKTLFMAPIACCSDISGFWGYGRPYVFLFLWYFLGLPLDMPSISWKRTLSDISETLWGIKSSNFPSF